MDRELTRLRIQFRELGREIQRLTHQRDVVRRDLKPLELRENLRNFRELAEGLPWTVEVDFKAETLKLTAWANDPDENFKVKKIREKLGVRDAPVTIPGFRGMFLLWNDPDLHLTFTSVEIMAEAIAKFDLDVRDRCHQVEKIERRIVALRSIQERISNVVAL